MELGVESRFAPYSTAVYTVRGSARRFLCIILDLSVLTCGLCKLDVKKGAPPPPVSLYGRALWFWSDFTSKVTESLAQVIVFFMCIFASGIVELVQAELAVSPEAPALSGHKKRGG